VVGDQGFELICQRGKAARQRPARISLDLPIGDMRETIALSLDQPPAGGAKAGIETEDFQARRSSSSSGTS
jgi:hypothetical protein